MNKQTRAKLTKLHERAGSIQDMLNMLKEEIEEIRNEEQDKYDNMPESFQNGDKGEAMQSAIDSLDNVISSIEESADTVGSAMDDLINITEG